MGNKARDRALTRMTVDPQSRAAHNYACIAKNCMMLVQPDRPALTGFKPARKKWQHRDSQHPAPKPKPHC